MTVFNFNSFGGMIPKLGEQKLPGDAADFAANCELTTGNLKALREAQFRDSLAPATGVAAAYRLQPDGGGDVWATFSNRYTHFHKGALVNDAYDRYYWTEETEVPKYNTRARIVAGDPALLLGVPAPTDAPVVTASGGSGELEVTRAYVWTWISPYGEEGAPSPPTVAVGNDDGTWTVDTLTAGDAVPDVANRAPGTWTKRLYRTISGTTGTTYFFVEEVNVGTEFTADTSDTDEVALNNQLESFNWNEPPSDMIGMVSHPNGFFVGFSERNIYFSEPYRPHAWPAEYTVSTVADIMGLGIFGTSLGVPTQAWPYVCTGVHPANMALTKIEAPEPCLSRLGVASSLRGVFYPSPNGLMLIDASGVHNVSQPVMGRDIWEAEYRPGSIEATTYRGNYVALYNDSDGFIFAFDNPGTGYFSELDNFFQNYTFMGTDRYDGQVTFVKNDEVFFWDDPRSVPLFYRWLSKELVPPKPVNFGAYRIDIRAPTTYDLTDQATREAYNASRITFPLDPLDYTSFNDARVEAAVVPITVPQVKQPLGGSPLLLAITAGDLYVKITIWAKRVKVYEQVITESGRYRLPSGFKSDIWQVQFEGNAEIHHFKMAETGKELGAV